MKRTAERQEKRNIRSSFAQKKKSVQIKSDADFHRLQVAFGSSAVHVTPPPFPHPPRGVTARLLCFQCERRRHTVSFLSLLSGTSRTARRFLQIPAYSQGRCELMPKESRAQSRQKSSERGVGSKTERVAFFFTEHVD